MAETKKTPIVIDGIEHLYEDMSEQEQVLVNHVADLDRKIASSKFNLDQLQVGREAFIQMLKNALNTTEETSANKE